MIALCGCMMQEPEVVEKLQKSYRFVDLIFGTHNIYKFAELIVNCFECRHQIIDIWKDTDQIVEDLPSERNIHLNQVSILCLDAIIFAVIVLYRMSEEEREAEIRRILSVRSNNL